MNHRPANPQVPVHGFCHARRSSPKGLPGSERGNLPGRRSGSPADL